MYRWGPMPTLLFWASFSPWKNTGTWWPIARRAGCDGLFVFRDFGKAAPGPEPRFNITWAPNEFPCQACGQSRQYDLRDTEVRRYPFSGHQSGSLAPAHRTASVGDSLTRVFEVSPHAEVPNVQRGRLAGGRATGAVPNLRRAVARAGVAVLERAGDPAYELPDGASIVDENGVIYADECRPSARVDWRANPCSRRPERTRATFVSEASFSASP